MHKKYFPDFCGAFLRFLAYILMSVDHCIRDTAVRKTHRVSTGECRILLFVCFCFLHVMEYFHTVCAAALQMANSPSSSRGWLCTVEPAGCSDLRGRPTGRRDSSLHPYPRSSGGLKDKGGNIQIKSHRHTLDIKMCGCQDEDIKRRTDSFTYLGRIFFS